VGKNQTAGKVFGRYLPVRRFDDVSTQAAQKCYLRNRDVRAASSYTHTYEGLICEPAALGGSTPAVTTTLEHAC
jgi:hypothetical protein